MLIHQRVVFLVGLVLTLVCPACRAQQSGIAISETKDEWISLPSQWQEYFGVHDSTEAHPESWRTVREFGGPNLILPPTDVLSRAAARKGPFTGKQVHVDLAMIRWQKRDGTPGLDKLIPMLMQQNQTSVFIVPANTPRFPDSLDQDTTYWILHDVHEKFRGADKHALWQRGNEVNAIDMFDMFNQLPEVESGKKTVWQFFNQPKAADAYVENYFAPGVEVLKRVSKEIYGDADHLPVVCGSIANIFNADSVNFLESILSHEIRGEHAASLKGKVVGNMVHMLTLHYPFNDPKGEEVIQGFLDRWVRTGKIPQLWLTEEHGNNGQGPATVVERGMKYLNWVAKNKLTAEQSRLIWWGPDLERPGGQPFVAIYQLGGYLGGSPIRLKLIQKPEGRIYLLAAGSERADRFLVAAVPESGKTIDLSTIQIETKGDAQEKWIGQLVRYSISKPQEKSALEVMRAGPNLKLSAPDGITEPALIFVSRRACDQEAIVK